MWFAEIVIALMQDRNDMKLFCVIPFENQAVKWTEEQRNRYYSILEKSTNAHMITTHYLDSCRQLCGEYTIDHSSFLLAILNGSADLLATQILDYAKSKGCGIIYIDPDNGMIAPITVHI